MRAAGLLAAPAPKALYSGFLRPPALSLAFRPCEIRCWLQTDMQPPEYEVRFTPKTGHSWADVRFSPNYVRSYPRSRHSRALG